MSLYAFGKVIGADTRGLAERLRTIGRAESVTISVAEIDREDLEAIEEVDGLGQRGVVFSIFSGPSDTDATELWIEARDWMLQGRRSVADESASLEGAVSDVFQRTRLSRACSGVLNLGQVGAVALVDGGIEQVFEGTLDGCLRQMASDVCVPWDQAPNRIYVRR